MSDNSAAADAMPVRRALQRCSSGPGCPCASHSDDSSSAARSPPSGSPSRSRSASTENTNSGDSINDNGSYRFTDSEIKRAFLNEQALLSSLYSLIHGVISRAVKMYFLHFVVMTVFVQVVDQR
ncbi:uncharacterized protein [Miscanthus floridulus]|uniref:uncharacterized protein isoform X1 n=1 Tax=Miscanthus floridulus TaxID=154761 RepID=UPI0034582249